MSTTGIPQPLPLESRKTALQGRINHYLSQGYRVVSQTDTTAQLVRPKKFSCLIALLSVLAVGIGFIIYIFWYMGKKDDTVYLTVDEQARVSERRN